MSEYEQRVAAQIAQYENNTLRLFPPPAHHYWMRNFVQKKINAVFGVKDHIEFYIQPLLKAKKPVSLLSVGSGDGGLEVQLVKRLAEHGVENVTLHMTEISPIRQDRAKALVTQQGMDAHFEWHILDLNKEFVNGKFDLIFAHHVLHHIVELELLFDNIAKALAPSASFSTIDMIGRNGHMRWPEALEYTELAWKIIPDHWKYNFQLQAQHENYLNFDCSKSGFEGIRAQDILPLLIEKFDFSGFVGEGGFHDVILDRGYGQNIDMENPHDAALVRFLCETNELLIESGKVKPTIIFAQMRKKTGKSAKTKVWKSMTPEASVRPT